MLARRRRRRVAHVDAESPRQSPAQKERPRPLPCPPAGRCARCRLPVISGNRRVWGAARPIDGCARTDLVGQAGIGSARCTARGLIASILALNAGPTGVVRTADPTACDGGLGAEGNPRPSSPPERRFVAQGGGENEAMARIVLRRAVVVEAHTARALRVPPHGGAAGRIKLLRRTIGVVSARTRTPARSR